MRTDLWLTAAEIDDWVREYNATGIDADYPPPEKVIEQVASCSFAVCSDLPRSVESAAALGIERLAACDPMFREMEVPYASWRFPKLSLSAWLVLFGLMWAMGYSANGESISEGRERARRCAQRLSEMAGEHGRVVFVGHGSLMWFIARRLREAGWSGPSKSPRKYWDFAVYRLEDATPRGSV